MPEPGFASLYDSTLLAIEDAVEALDADIDFETVNQILTLAFPDESCIIITPQSATGQLWVAARSGGFHFGHDGQSWKRTTDGKSLQVVLDELFRDQGGVPLDF